MSVSDLTRECFVKFNDAMLERGSLEHQDPLDSRLADFNLWVDNVGATARSGASLDSRFRARPDDLALVKNILSVLSDLLVEYTDLVRNTLPAAGALASIDSTIRNLAIIGVAIRRTGKASRSRKANQSFNPEEHCEFRKHLECLILLRPSEDQPRLDGVDISNVKGFIESGPEDKSKQGDIVAAMLKQLVKSKMEDLNSSRLNEIQIRLIEANLRRRHNFLLAQKRSQRTQMIEKKTAVETQRPDESPLAFSKTSPIAVHSAQAMPLTPLEPRDELLKSKAPPTMTGFSRASTAEGTLQFNLARKQRPAPAVARSQISFIAANTEFPKPPSSSSHQLVFKCPCCCQSLPSEEFANPSRWKQHLIEDLCPYTCIAQSCPTPDLLFTRRKAWELHVENDHPPQWQCLLCDGDDEPFSTMEDITTHTEARHKEELSDYTLSFLVSSAEVRYMGIRSCPLCSSHGPRDSPELVDHVVRHAYEFSLYALPWPKLALEDLNKPIGTYALPEDAAEAEQLQNWVSEVSPLTAKECEVTRFDVADHSLQVNKDYGSEEDYFANNYYFEDQASADTSQCQFAQERSIIVWSESSYQGFSDQHIYDDLAQKDRDLMKAAKDGDELAVQSLLDDVQIIDPGEEMRTRALIGAVEKGNIEVVKELLENSLDKYSHMNSRDAKGRTALFSAVEQEDESMARYLIESGIEVNYQDQIGRTALFSAVERNNKSMARCLIDSGIDMNIKDKNGQTVLLAAMGKADKDMMSLLLTADTYGRFRRDYGKTPLSCAMEGKYKDTEGFILGWLNESPLNWALEIYAFEDSAAVARNVKQGDDWFVIFNPSKRVLDIQLVETFQNEFNVQCVALSHDEKHLAIGGDRCVRILDIQTRKKLSEMKIPGKQYVETIRFGPDGRCLAAGSPGDNSVQVWDTVTKSVSHRFWGHSGGILGLDFSPDGRLIASTSEDRTFRVWNLEHKFQIAKFSIKAWGVAFSPDSCFLAVGADNGSAFLWGLKKSLTDGSMRPFEPDGHRHMVYSVAFSSDGKHLVTAGKDKTFNVWNLNDGTCRLTLGGQDMGNFYSVCVTRDNRWIITFSEDGYARFWDLTTGAIQCVIRAHKGEIYDYSLSSQGSSFAMIPKQGTVRIWSYNPYRPA